MLQGEKGLGLGKGLVVETRLLQGCRVLHGRRSAGDLCSTMAGGCAGRRLQLCRALQAAGSCAGVWFCVA